MNEYKNAVMILVLLIGRKAERIKQLRNEVDELEKYNKDLCHDLKVARQHIQELKNDLKDLSTEFNRWRNGQTKKEA